jgi:ubiquinone/menaquinone biosynthesis C-methylase UbiE
VRVSGRDAVFAGSVPALYDHHLGPLLFEPFAADLAGRLADLREGRLLEVAAGTGVVTRALLQALPASVEIVATDLYQAMLDVATARIRAPNVTFRQADALALPFGDASFDAVVCQFGAMFFRDKRAGYREARRVLKPGGRFLFNVWDRIEENEVTRIATDAVAALFPHDPPSFFNRVPHGYHDTAAISEELRSAGFTQVEVETVERRSRAPSPREPAVGLCQGTPLRNEIEARDPGRLEEATDAAEKALAERFGRGPVENRMRAHVVTAVR